MAAAVFTICLGLSIFLVAHFDVGRGPAFLALTLFVFEPNFLAHGALVTTDIGATLGLFLGVASFYFYLKRPSALRLTGAGLAAGLCLGAKLTGILLFPMLLFLALAELLSMRDPTARKFAPGLAMRALWQAASLAGITAISLVVLWSLYGFRYAARPAGLSEKPPLSEFAKHMGHNSSAIVLRMADWHLLPESLSLRLWRGYFFAETIPTVIFGKYYPAPQWFYFPAVFIIKSTLEFLMFCCLLPLSGPLWSKRFRRETLFLVIPPAIYLAVAMSSGLNFGVRHLLPVYPFLIVLTSFAVWNLAERGRVLAILIAVLVVCHAVSSVWAFPNYIPYANELWGGPAKSHELLTDSNVDWGQGLMAMKRYIDQRQIKNCWFASFGSSTMELSYYGIPCQVLPPAFAASNQSRMPIVPPQVDGPVFLSATEVSRMYWRADLKIRISIPANASNGINCGFHSCIRREGRSVAGVRSDAREPGHAVGARTQIRSSSCGSGNSCRGCAQSPARTWDSGHDPVSYGEKFRGARRNQQSQRGGERNPRDTGTPITLASAS